MKGSRRQFLLGQCCMLAALAPSLAALPAYAQPYPGKLIRLVTGSAAGGAADITARHVATRLSESLKQQIIVDNRPGVAGMLANEYVSKAAPDGYTLLLQPGSFMTVSPILNAKGAWDPTRHPRLQQADWHHVVRRRPHGPPRHG